MYNNFSSKKTKKVISALLASALVVTSAPITADAATSKVLGVGKTFKVTKTTKVSGLSAAEKKIVKVTVNKSKKTVTVKGLKAGKAAFKIGSKSYNVKVGATAIKAKNFATTLTVGTNKAVSVTATNGKKDTLTWKSSQTGVVKVSNATTKASSSKVAKNTLKPVKAGKSTITVKSKYTGKSLKVKVTVKAADATVTATPTATGGAVATPTQTPTQAPAQTPSAQETQNPVQTPSAQETQNPATATAGAVTVTANVPGASIKITSGSAVLSAISMDADKTSATTAVLAPGTYAIEVSKDGYDPYKGTVTVNGATAVNVTLKESIQTGATATVINALANYKNTVLVNDNAQVTVTVKDANGAPVANKSVIFSLVNPKFKAGTNAPKDAGFEIKGNEVATTDASGTVTFIVGAERQGLKVNDTNYVGSVEFRASVVGSTDKADVATGAIGFAAIQLGTAELVEDKEKIETHLVSGENAVEAKTDAQATTTALSGLVSDYIATQQVSKAGTKENQVTFTVDPKIVLPTYDDSSDDAKEFIQTIDKQSGEYGTYTDKSEIVPLDVDTSKLQYATLNIKNIQLSKYTKMVIECYSDEKCETDDFILGSRQTVPGEKEQSSFAYQIPLTKGKVKAVKVSLESAGQVQTDKNDGFDLTSITGVYNGVGMESEDDQSLSSAKINWEVATPTLSNEMVLKKEDAIKKLGITPADVASDAAVDAKLATSSTFTYQVPVFPYTGNAVIKEYDKNNNVITYYLTPTMNDVDTNGDYKNANEIAAFVNEKLPVVNPYKGVTAYKATEEEATKLLSGNIEVDGNKVRVNSEKVGSTTVKGTISIDGIGSDQLNAINSTVYTSVHWNPIPVGEKVDESNAFLALAGQKITVYAQLTDANNNPVSLANEKVTFNYGTKNIAGNDTAVDGVTIVSNNGTTDVNGRTKLVLSAAQADELIKLNAEADNSKYNVVLLVGGVNATPVEKADLYWVDANLSFKNSVLEGWESVQTNNNSVVADVSDPLVGTPWEFAVKTVGDKIEKDKGELSEYEIDVNGLKIAMSGDADNKGTYDFTTGNGVALATSKIADKDKIIAKIDSSSVTSDVTFKATKELADDTKDVKEFVCVGEGSPNLNAKLTLNVNWQKEGTKLALITPMGTNIGATGTSIYVKVTDGTGENVAAGETVTFKSGNETDVFVVDGKESIGKARVTTNSDGIAKVEIKKSAAASSIVSATVENVDQIVSTTINWVNNTTPFHVVNAAMKENSATEVELTFNNEVLAESVQAGEFNLYSKNDQDKITYYDVTSAKASGKKVILTVSQALAAGQYTIDFGTKKVDGVTYQLVDEAGKAIAAESKINFYSTKNASYDLSQTTVGGETTITISNVKSPVDPVKVNDFIVTVDGVVIGTVTDNGDKTYSVKVNQKVDDKGNVVPQTVVIYYFGNAESTKVQ